MYLNYTFILIVIIDVIVFVVCNDHEELLQMKPYDSFVELKGGEFTMGIDDRNGKNFEYPKRKAIVKPFRIMLYPVTVASFRKYMKDKYRYKTTADFNGYSYVFNKTVNKDAVKIQDKYGYNKHMVAVRGAKWNRPEGGASKINDKFKYPVVHVSFNDAIAYCTWKKMRLPSEIEWEYAARAGLKDKQYPWGDYWEVGRTNLWQGDFPENNQLRDKHYSLSPVDAFDAQNSWEIYDLIGNVWEWTTTIYRDIHNSSDKGDRRVLKGGSFIESRDGENNIDNVRIRISARIGLNPTYTAQNIGFRCVQSIEENKDSPKYKVIRLRPPVAHNKPNSTVFINAVKETKKLYKKDEL